MFFVVGGDLVVGHGIEKFVAQFGRNDFKGGLGRHKETRPVRSFGPGNVFIHLEIVARLVLGRVGDLIEVLLDRERSGVGLERAVEPLADRGLFPRNGGESSVPGRHRRHRGDRIVPPSAVGAPNHPVVDQLVLQKENQAVLAQAGGGQPLREMLRVQFPAEEGAQVVADVVFGRRESVLPSGLNDEPAVHQIFGILAV